MSLTDYHERFAAVYDVFYKARDVAGEVQAAVELLGLAPVGSAVRTASGPVPAEKPAPHILDFGCGTGSHVLLFAQHGIKATGFDRSEAMIAEARAKQTDKGSAEVSFAGGSLEAFCSQMDGLRFDGAASFFNVLNCIETPGQMVSQLGLIRSRLAPGARMLADVWNGAAVFADQPRPDVRHYTDPKEPQWELVRIAVPELDRISQCCTLRYRVLKLNREKGSFNEFESVHKLRFLTPVQYRHLFELAGFSIVDEFPKGKPRTPVTEHDWYISYLVRRDG